MTHRATINLSDNLTIDHIRSAVKLMYMPYIAPIDAVGDMLNWDFQASFSTGADSTGIRNLFAFGGMAGATYDILSQSFLDPFVLQLFDAQGNLIASDDLSGTSGTDHIKFIAPYDGAYYVDASWHQGLADSEKYASLAIYEDLDTLPPGHTTPFPSVLTFSPANFSADVPIDSNIVLTFSESIQRGSGSIIIQTADNRLVESFDAASSNNVQISSNILTLNPANNLSTSTEYFVTLASGSLRDFEGNSNARISSYHFTTVAQILDAPSIDRIFNWGENRYPDLFPDHPESQEIFDYYARIYSNGNALGERNGDIYFYDGGTDGTNDISLVGTANDFLSQAISAGF
jgi:hypothetical protein